MSEFKLKRREPTELMPLEIDRLYYQLGKLAYKNTWYYESNKQDIFHGIFINDIDYSKDYKESIK